MAQVDQVEVKLQPTRDVLMLMIDQQVDWLSLEGLIQSHDLQVLPGGSDAGSRPGELLALVRPFDVPGSSQIMHVITDACPLPWCTTPSASAALSVGSSS
jgi:hypothetical protein